MNPDVDESLLAFPIPGASKEDMELVHQLAKKHPRFVGVIVGRWNSEKKQVDCYWDGDTVWAWNTGGRIDYPHMYKRVFAAMRMSQRLNEDPSYTDKHHTWCPCYFIAPELERSYVPLEVYQLMTGVKYHGSPTR